MPGNTRTGGVLEAMILPALDRGKYLHQAQVAIGERLGCGRHVVDAVAENHEPSLVHCRPCQYKDIHKVLNNNHLLLTLAAVPGQAVLWNPL